MRHFITTCTSLTLLIVCTLPALGQGTIPDPYFPKNGVVTEGPNITFKWNSSAGALSYDLQYATDISFSSPTTISAVSGTSHIVNAIGNGQTYYWRVRANTAGGPGSWSTIYQLGVYRPTDFANLEFWIRGDGLIVKDGFNNVSDWQDESTNGYSVVQADNNLKPLYVANGLNGKPVIRFSGAQALNGGDILDLDHANRSVFILGKSNAVSGTFIAKSIYAASSLPRFSMVYTGSSNFEALYLDDSGNKSIDATTPINKWYTFTNVVDRTPQTQLTTLFINGVDKGSKNGISDSSFIYNNYFHFLVGTYNDPAGTGTNYKLPLNGDIAEIMLYDEAFPDSLREIIEQYLEDKYAPPVDLGADVIYDYGFCDTVIHAGDYFTNYVWSDGSTNKSLTVSEPGTYSVTVADLFGRVSVDTIKVFMPDINFSSAAMLCLDDSTLWDTGLDTATYSFIWSTGKTGSSIFISAPGNYQVTATDTNGCSSVSAITTFSVDSFKNNIDITTGPDTSLCSSNLLGLETGAQLVVSYQWSTGDTTPTVAVDTAGNYSVTVTDANGCVASRSVNVTILGQGPTANFSFDTVCAGAPVNFTDLSVIDTAYSISAWQWNFGDSNTDTIQNPAHAYNNAGNYTVSLVSTSNNGCVGTPVTKTVWVRPAITAYFADSLACLNATANFFSQSTAPPGDTIISWFWDFGNASTASIKNPTTIYNATGSFTSSLVVGSVNGCTDTFSRNVVVGNSSPLPQTFSLVSPVPNSNIITDTIHFDWSDSPGASRYILQISANANFTAIVSTSNTFSSNFDLVGLPFSTGTYYWRVVAYNVCGDTRTSTFWKLCRIDPNVFGTHLLFWVSGDGLVTKSASNKVSQWKDASGNSNNLAQAGSSFQPLWVQSISQLNNKPVLRFSGTQFMSAGDKLDYKKKGRTTFIIGKSNQPTGCYYAKSQASNSPYRYGLYWNNSTLNYFIHDNQALRIASSSITAGSYEMINITADRNTGIIGLYRNSQYLIPATNLANSSTNIDTTFRFLVGAYNDATDNGQTLYLDGDIAEIIIFDTLLNAQEIALVEKYLYTKYSGTLYLGPDITIDYGFCDSVVLDASERYQSYLWSTGETTRTIHPTVSGQYSVTVTDVFNQQYSDTVRVTLPSVAPPPSPSICLGDSVSWNAYQGPGYSYLWSTGSADSSITINSPGDYLVTISDTNGCSYITDTFHVLLDSFVITTTLGPDTTLCKNEQLGLATNANQIIQYNWSTTATTPAITVTTPGTYSVSVTNYNGCLASDTIDIALNGQIANVAFQVGLSGCFGDSTYFTNQSTIDPPFNILNYTWDFGDTFSTVNTTDPVHYYTGPGSYDVTLTVEADSNCVSSVTQTLTIYDKPTAKFSYEISCAGQPLTFRDSSSGVLNDPLVSWQWDFGDNTTATNVLNPTHTYAGPGVYAVTLTVTSQTGCFAIATDSIEIFPELIAAIGAANLCYGQNVQFTDASPGFSNIEWFWQFGDGAFSFDEDPTHTYAQPGSYIVSLSVTNALGCQTTTSDTITISQAPVAGFSADPGCTGKPVQFYDQTVISGTDSIAHYYWEFGDSTVISRLPNPQHVYAQSGTYTVNLYVTSINGCTDQISQNITIAPKPVADFSFTPMFGGSPLNVNFTDNSSNAVSYLWDFGSGDTSTLQNPSYTYLVDSSYTIVLTVTGIGGCASSATDSILVATPLLDLQLDNLKARLDNGQLYISVIVANVGNRDVYDFDLEAAIGNGSVVLEAVDSTLLSGGSMLYNLRVSYLASDPEKESYLCLRSTNPNGETDINPTNDKQCITLENKLKIVPPYPNPASDVINLDLVLPDADQLTITMYNDMGQEIRQVFDDSATKGLNSFSVDLSTLPRGVYMFRIKYQGEYYTEKFVADD